MNIVAYMACNVEDESNSEEERLEGVVVVSFGINRANQRKTISNESRVLSSLLVALTLSLSLSCLLQFQKESLSHLRQNHNYQKLVCCIYTLRIVRLTDRR